MVVVTPEEKAMEAAENSDERLRAWLASWGEDFSYLSWDQGNYGQAWNLANAGAIPPSINVSALVREVLAFRAAALSGSPTPTPEPPKCVGRHSSAKCPVHGYSGADCGMAFDIVPELGMTSEEAVRLMRGRGSPTPTPEPSEEATPTRDELLDMLENELPAPQGAYQTYEERLRLLKYWLKDAEQSIDLLQRWAAAIDARQVREIARATLEDWVQGPPIEASQTLEEIEATVDRVVRRFSHPKGGQ